MEITEVRISLRGGSSNTEANEARAAHQFVKEGIAGESRLKAYATVTFDQCFVVRNIKIIAGKNGLFVAMPSNKPKLPCARCHMKNELGGKFCAYCGGMLNRTALLPTSTSGAGSLEAQTHRDIVHPITAVFRQYLQQKVLEAYEAQRVKAGPPNTDTGGADVVQ